jgi:hypothetical protein
MLSKLENDPQIITRTASPRVAEFAFEFVCLERRIVRICFKQPQRELKIDYKRGIPFDYTTSCPDKVACPKKNVPHRTISRINSSTVLGFALPAACSRRA